MCLTAYPNLAYKQPVIIVVNELFTKKNVNITCIIIYIKYNQVFSETSFVCRVYLRVSHFSNRHAHACAHTSLLVWRDFIMNILGFSVALRSIEMIILHFRLINTSASAGHKTSGIVFLLEFCVAVFCSIVIYCHNTSGRQVSESSVAFVFIFQF